MKKSIILFGIFFLFLFAQNTIAAEGDIIWEQTNNLTTGNDIANKVVSDASGVYIVGYEGYASPTGMKMRIEKRSHADGNIIWEKTFNPRNQGFAEIYDIVIDANFLYIAGANYVCCFNSDLEWRVEKRVLTDGSLVWSMGDNFSAGDFRWDKALGVAVDATGVYAVGRMQSGATVLWRAEKRSLIDGNIIWTRNQAVGGAWAYSATVDSSGLYVISPILVGSQTQWYIVKLSLYDGNNVLWAQTTNFSAPNSYPQGVAVSGLSLYIVGTDPSWSIDKRDANNGGLIWHKTENSIGYSTPYDVILNSSGDIYIVGFRQDLSNLWRIERRDSNGVLQLPWPKEFDPTQYGDVASGISIGPGRSSVYIAGYSSYDPNNQQWRIEKREIVTTPICTGSVSIAWTDANIIAGTTKIRAVHINELRANTNLRRQDAGLTDYTWTDSTLTTGTTKIKTAHLQEIRNAISEVYTTCGQTTPTFTDSTLTAGATKIRKTHIDELRSAISSAP